jgi:hypothetical protein
MAGGKIDLDEIAAPEILDPCQVEGLQSLRSGNVLWAITHLVNRDHASFTLPPLLPDHRASGSGGFGNAAITKFYRSERVYLAFRTCLFCKGQTS